jgi:hypothetical protein
MTVVKVFWTTLNPFNGVADWQDWLDTHAGSQGRDWGWFQSDVVAGDYDERTVIGIWFNNEAIAMLFKLSHDCEFYLGEKTVDKADKAPYNDSYGK